MVALLEVCDVTSKGRHLGGDLGVYQELEIRLKPREMVIFWWFFLVIFLKSNTYISTLHDFSHKINRLLTEREGRTGEYWPEVGAVRTERSEVRTATTKGQYSPVRLEQARLVSCLYSTRLLIVKSTSGALWLALKGLPPWRILDDARKSDKSKLPLVRKTIHWCEIALH